MRTFFLKSSHHNFCSGGFQYIFLLTSSFPLFGYYYLKLLGPIKFVSGSFYKFLPTIDANLQSILFVLEQSLRDF